MTGDQTRKLLWGPSIECLETEAFKWATETTDIDTGPTLPDQVLYLVSERNREEEIKSRWDSFGSPQSIRVLTISEFVEHCYEQTRVGLDAAQMSQEVRLRVTEAALESLPDDSRFGGTSGPGMVEQVADLLSLLEFAELHDEADVREHVREAGEPMLAEKLAAVRETFDRTRGELSEEDGTTLESERYRAVFSDGDLSSCFPATEAVVLGGFDRFSPLEATLVETIAAEWPTAAVVPRVATPENTSSASESAPTGVETVLKRAWKMLLELGFEPKLVRASESAERPFEKLAGALFKGETRVDVNESGSFEIVSPSTASAEVRVVARKVRDRIADEDEPDEIGIVITDEETYGDSLRRALATQDVPVAAAGERTLESTAVGRALLDAVAVVQDPTSVSDARSLFENAVVRPTDDWFEDRRAEVIAELDEVEGEAIDVVESTIRRILESIADECSTDIPETVDELETFVFDGLGVKDAVEDRDTESANKGVASASAIEREALETAHSSLESVRIVHGSDAPLSRAKQALATVSVELSASDYRNAVSVLEFGEVGAATFERLFVIGLTAEHFPSRGPRLASAKKLNEAHPDFQHSDPARRAEYRFACLLANASEVVLSRPRVDGTGRSYADASVLTEVKRLRNEDGLDVARDEFEDLVDGDEPGSITVGSREDATRALAVVGANADRVETKAGSAEEGDQHQNALTAAISSGAFETGGVANHVDLDNKVSFDPAKSAAIHATSGTKATFQRRTGTVGRYTAGDVPLPDVEKLSPSRIETYAKCGFRYFARHVLKLETDDDDTALRWGQYVDGTVTRFYKGLSEECGTPVDLTAFDRDELEQRLLEAALVPAAELEDNESSDDEENEPSHEEFDERRLEGLLAGLAGPESNPHYEPIPNAEGTLVQFLDKERQLFVPGAGCDEPTTVEPSHFQAGGAATIGDVDVSGRIDRLDIGGGHVVVRDYKTGNVPSQGKKNKLGDTLDGLRFQLPIYLLLAIDSDEIDLGENVVPAGGTYYKLDDGRGDGASLWGSVVGFKDVMSYYTKGGAPLVRDGIPRLEKHSEFEQFLTEEVPDRVQAIAESISNGRFTPTINEPKNAGCEYCSYRDACDVRHETREDLIDSLDRAGDAYIPLIARAEQWTPESTDAAQTETR